MKTIFKVSIFIGVIFFFLGSWGKIPEITFYFGVVSSFSITFGIMGYFFMPKEVE